MASYFQQIFVLFVSCVIFGLISCTVEDVVQIHDSENFCPCEKSFKRFVPKFFANWLGMGCSCSDALSNVEKKERCLHGYFNGSKQTCECEQCWTGKLCDQLKSEHKPTFQKSYLHLKVSEKDLKESRVATIPEFTQNTCLLGNCPCGKTKYSLEGQDKTFFIHHKTGVINTTAKRLLLKRYRFNIYIYNEHDRNPEAKLKLVLAIDHGVPISNYRPVGHDNSIGHDNDVSIGHDDDVAVHNNDEGDLKVLSRRRRSVNTNHPLIVTCTPYLKDTYYFNIGETIVFRTRLTYNSTGSYSNSISSITINVTSEWLKLSDFKMISPDQSGNVNGDNEGIVSGLSLNSGGDSYGNITGTVIKSVEPLSNLNILCEATGTYDSGSIKVSQKSSPTVLVVFPDVNVTRMPDGAINVYNKVSFVMKIKLPLLNYTLYLELSTNIEDYVFMGIENVVINKKTAVNYEKPGTPVYYSSQDNHEKDRVAIDLGALTVDENSAEEDREITVSFDVQVDDHASVVDQSVHYLGLGMKTGNNTVWVSQEGIIIAKDEPALKLEVTSTMDNHTHLYIGDQTEITTKISHVENASTKDALNVEIHLITDFFEVISESISALDKRTISKVSGSYIANIKLKVKENILPFQRLPLKVVVTYENKEPRAKRNLTYNVPAPLSGTPIMNFTLTESPDVFPGDKRKFSLDIQMTKMRSYVDVEIVLPVVGDIPMMRLTSMNVSSSGSNVKLTKSPLSEFQPTYLNSTSLKRQNDQAFLNLSLVSLTNPESLDADANKVSVEFTACINEHFNITNGSQIEVGAGVIGAPYMVWVAVLNLNGFISKNPRPWLDFNFEMFNKTKDEFQMSMKVEHNPTKSTRIAYDVTFEFYLTPYVKYKSVEEISPLLEQSNTIKTRFKTDVLYCMEDVFAKVAVNLDRSKCPHEGWFNFSLAAHITYYDKDRKKYSYFKLLSRRMKANPRFVTIPKHLQRVPEYYGRGIFAAVNPKDVGSIDLYLCMNQHVASEHSACYHSPDKGNTWYAMDNRFGCILGLNNKNEVVGVSRNQRHYVYYDSAIDRHLAFINGEQTLPPQSHKNLEDALYVDLNDGETTVDSKHVLEISNEEFTGAGDGIYHRTKGSGSWKIIAKWVK